MGCAIIICINLNRVPVSMRILKKLRVRISFSTCGYLLSHEIIQQKVSPIPTEKKKKNLKMLLYRRTLLARNHSQHAGSLLLEATGQQTRQQIRHRCEHSAHQPLETGGFGHPATAFSATDSYRWQQHLYRDTFGTMLEPISHELLHNQHPTSTKVY